MGITWDIDSLHTLPLQFLMTVRRRLGDGKVRFGETGRGIRPNYQVETAAGIFPYRGSNHQLVALDAFAGDNLSKTFAAADLARVMASIARRSATPDAWLAEVAVLDAVPDAEATRAMEAYSREPNWFFTDWLPRYEDTLEAVSKSLDSPEPDTAFALVWRAQDNSISNAGRGMIDHETVDRLRPRLTQVLFDIRSDPSPANFETILRRFEQWQADGELSRVPRLMIARAFAAIHPDIYHTTVDGAKHDRAIEWHVRHTGLTVPDDSATWAEKAVALTAHLSTLPLFRTDPLRRNMFAWFVVSHLHEAVEEDVVEFGHRPRAGVATAMASPEAQREIQLRENLLQTQLNRELVEEFGEKSVKTEKRTNTRTAADAFVVTPDGRRRLYEIKVTDRASLAIRLALGQLLEYSYAGGLHADEFIVVAEPLLDERSAEYLSTLRSKHNLPIAYRQITLQEIAGERTPTPRATA